MGTDRNVFEDNLKMLKQNYEVIDLNDVIKYLYSDFDFNSSKTGMLITFDDGLSDHYEAAKILAEHNMRGVFFIPTCIIEDKLPANPTIIHYCIAKYGIRTFLNLCEQSFMRLNYTQNNLRLSFTKGKDDPWEIIAKIKLMFKYELDSNISRAVLVDIYKESLLRDHPNALELMHLTEHQIKKMIQMGHYFGSHTHTHISVGPSKLSDAEQITELSNPKKILESRFGIHADSFSYPFGEITDCLSANKISKYLKQYKLIFTVNQIMNTKKTSPYELGRYQPISTDTTEILQDKLSKIKDGL